ncbi:MAG: TonB-dependent receptor [Ferruginibacter sp.]|nr:TonB-dependent receptor [Cytophagales bacterium]
MPVRQRPNLSGWPGFLLLLFLFSPFLASAQTIRGSVRDGSEDNRNQPVVGANVYWLVNAPEGGLPTALLGTVTDAEGRFELHQPDDALRTLVISFVGYRSDTVEVGRRTELDVALEPVTQLREVTVRAGSTFISRADPMKVETLTAKALQKAACCNLSESFETNASVSVSYADAVTGAKQVQMLGLSGTYVQINTENIPSVRGLATTYGLQYLPGTWIASIDVGKGAGSVVNGYESITGQLNVELQKPEKSERLYLNTYVNDMGRAELNLNLSHRIGPRWSTGLLLHTSRMDDLVKDRMDRNGDGFFDLPMFTQYNLLHRWKYQGEKWMAQFGVKALYENRRGGQLDYYHRAGDYHASAPVDTNGHGGDYGAHGGGPDSTPAAAPVFYGIGSTTRRVEAFSKTARLFPDAPYKGLGLILSAVNHDQQSFFGLTHYDGRQRSLYANLIYQSIFSTTNHTYKVGASYLLDDYREQYRTVADGDSVFARTESVPGVFGEYTFTVPDKFTLVAGARTDFHNRYGLIFTPRLHLKYDLTPQTIVRASAGSGFRVANPLAENVGVLASSRQLVVPERLQPERAWNYGLNLTQEFRLADRQGTVGVDLYRTDFINQVIVDLETPRQVAFYNLKGRSYANNVQVELNYEPVKALAVKLAYKFYDVRSTIGRSASEQRLLEKQFVSRDRVLFNAAYATRFDKWKFDFTTQWNGRKRIPNVSPRFGQPLRPVFAPAYFILNTQVTKAFKKWDLYVGGENLTNFTQKKPIVVASEPFSPNFDASVVWGPVFGRMMYAGMRFKIK